VGLAAAVAMLALAYLALLLVAPRIDRLHVARGGARLYRCARLGGSIPVDLPGMVGLRPGVTHGSPTAVLIGDEAYVGMPVTTADGRTTIAVWQTGYRYGPQRPARAANEAAADVTDSPDARAGSPSAGAVAAATSCAERTP